jgi:hypothetical protein
MLNNVPVRASDISNLPAGVLSLFKSVIGGGYSGVDSVSITLYIFFEIVQK